MDITDVVAPSYKDLRPLKPPRTATFPVHPDLTDRLVAVKRHPDPVVAHVLATCAGYAYADAPTVAMMVARLGLEDNRCRMISEWVDVMFISSTAFLIQSRDGRVAILCYRGTPPTSLITWLTDVEVEPTRVPVQGNGSGAYVHGGFYRNVRSTRYELVSALERALEGRSVLEDAEPVPHALEALYITGHSLGGASASMLATMLAGEDRYKSIMRKLRAVYTFGQPMIASPELAERWDQTPFLRKHVIRYVYDNDIAPQLPPKASGPFRHFGVERQYKPRKNGGGRWQDNADPRSQLTNPLEILTTPLSVLAPQLRLTRHLRFHASTLDHLPQYYIAALTPEGVRSEFGD